MKIEKDSEDFEIDEDDLKVTLSAFTGVSDITKKGKNIFTV